MYRAWSLYNHQSMCRLGHSLIHHCMFSNQGMCRTRFLHHPCHLTSRILWSLYRKCLPTLYILLLQRTENRSWNHSSNAPKSCHRLHNNTFSTLLYRRWRSLVTWLSIDHRPKCKHLHTIEWARHHHYTAIQHVCIPILLRLFFYRAQWLLRWE